MPELQGYFPVRREGKLFFHFAFLITDAKEELNIALAGPRFFKVEPDGIAFWLGTREGMLVHVTAGVFEKLFAPETFVWYLADVAYDIDAGVYDLTLRRDGQDEPVVALVRQANTPRRRGSAVDKPLHPWAAVRGRLERRLLRGRRGDRHQPAGRAAGPRRAGPPQVLRGCVHGIPEPLYEEAALPADRGFLRTRPVAADVGAPHGPIAGALWARV
jgi:hypothetical protein